MTELTEAEAQKLNTGRQMRAESDVLLPLLDAKQALVLGSIISAFKAGEYEKLTGHAAELTTISELRNEITRKIRQAEAIERKQYE